MIKVGVAQESASSLRQHIEASPLGRMAKMEEIGDAITFLASPLSSFVQSAALVADGGFSMV